MELSLIVAVARNGVIGAGGTLPWHLSSDLKRFKTLTMGQTIVMGRRTHESIGRALPGRQNIVVTRGRLETEGIELALDLPHAIELATSDQVFVIGGAQLYCEALPKADRIYVTRVEAQVAGDTFFPVAELNAWTLADDKFQAATEKDDFDCRFQTYLRVSASRGDADV
jgi:dihydrofolate reductase